MFSFSVTETNTDDGLPHTLEHLVFMGSKKYPYKGVLDVIANRCLVFILTFYKIPDDFRHPEQMRIPTRIIRPIL